ncbi:PREDICTED: uncharacterized protein LOC109156680 [Ipomoea nil]|uniref:uncharacterized protein LOC109156680 n=1 Tax=Ipomoea nil TaxID=35883 RepID=UPI00090103DB|nr:PREDICTED: uncharacterized protein LOC109156680 [Ipomoea nil]
MADGSVNSSERTVSDAAMSSSSSSIVSLSTTHDFISTKLTYKNYLLWRTKVVPFLHGHDLMGFVDGTKPSPVVLLAADAMPRPNPAYAVWMRQDQALLSMLVSSLSDEVMPIAVGRRTSHALWKAIVQTLSSSSRARALNLLGQLQGLDQGDSSVADYIGRAQVIVEELTLAGRVVSLDDQNLFVFRGLRPEFRALTASLAVRGQPVTLQELADFLGAQEFIASRDYGGAPRLLLFSAVAADQVAEVRTVAAVNEQAVAIAGPIVVVAVDSKVAVGVVAAVADATVVAIRFSARYVGAIERSI